MDSCAKRSPIGSNGISFLPYGNGAERSLGNRNVDSSMHGLQFAKHGIEDIYRAGQEGIVFAMNFGLGVMQKTGVDVEVVRAGNANMFKSDVFCEAFANTTGATVQLYNTDGAQGAARGAGLGAGIYTSPQDAFSGLEVVKEVKPEPEKVAAYQDAYQSWVEVLKSKLPEELLG